MRKKFLSRLVVFGVLASLLTVPVVFAGKHGQAGKSNIAHLYLYEKDPTTWEIVEGGAWGKMKYNLNCSTLDFVFNGHGLEPHTEYSLIYYPDPWPGQGFICLGNGTANKGGNVHIQESSGTGDLPAWYDENADPITTTHLEGKTGAKIWLVLSKDVDFDMHKMVGWNPTEYLFEYDLINYTKCRDGDDGVAF